MMTYPSRKYRQRFHFLLEAGHIINAESWTDSQSKVVASVTAEAVSTAVALPARQSPPIVEGKVPGKATTTKEIQAPQRAELETPAKTKLTTQLGVEHQAEVCAVDAEGEVRAVDAEGVHGKRLKCCECALKLEAASPSGRTNHGFVGGAGAGGRGSDVGGAVGTGVDGAVCLAFATGRGSRRPVAGVTIPETPQPGVPTPTE
ncbi:hypothetical protein PHYPSEUDO_001351 [Phytophthora pseudosyringae]|uniref:Uncharacterized protein n=1 Tax=Phytophthora pseudosyringae TaxID=221518 RepID=A0A8T1WET3_9STRA|nr:hypothetical protein PHYPSEUDO_001351 [Phytophthora pseudosyringae]